MFFLDTKVTKFFNCSSQKYFECDSGIQISYLNFHLLQRKKTLNMLYVTHVIYVIIE